MDYFNTVRHCWEIIPESDRTVSVDVWHNRDRETVTVATVKDGIRGPVVELNLFEVDELIETVKTAAEDAGSTQYSSEARHLARFGRAPVPRGAMTYSWAAFGRVVDEDTLLRPYYEPGGTLRPA